MHKTAGPYLKDHAVVNIKSEEPKINIRKNQKKIFPYKKIDFCASYKRSRRSMMKNTDL